MLRNYRKRHYTIIWIAIIMIVLSLLPETSPKWMNTLTYLVYVVGLTMLGLGEKTEKPDELAAYNLSIANKITMYASLSALFLFSVFIDIFIDNEVFSSIIFYWTFCGLLILRSAVFVVLDKKGEKMDNNE